MSVDEKDQVEIWLDTGLKCFATGSVSDAVANWERVLSVDPENARAHDYLSRVRDAFPRNAKMASPDSAPARDLRAQQEEMAVVSPLEDTPLTLSPFRVSDAATGVGAFGGQGVATSGAALTSAPVAINETLPQTHPWDSFDSMCDPVDLDTVDEAPTPFDLLFAAPQTESTLVDNGSQALVVDAHEDRAEPVPVGAGAAEATVSERTERLLNTMRSLFDLGDFSGSLDAVHRILELDPTQVEAQAYRARNEMTLLKMYESKLGDLTRCPRVVSSPDEVIWMSLHHRTSFLLSQIDGELSYEDLASVSGMSRLDTFRTLVELTSHGVIA